MLKSQVIELREFQPIDIEPLLNYWHNSDSNQLAFIGVEISKLSSEEVMRAALTREALLKPDQQCYVTILFQGAAIGVYLINQLKQNESAVFHAHIWDLDSRGKGIGTKTYRLACELFLKRFQLQRIIFRTPVQNQAAIRIKGKLGFIYLGEELAHNRGIIKDGTRLRVYEYLKK